MLVGQEVGQCWSNTYGQDSMNRSIFHSANLLCPPFVRELGANRGKTGRKVEQVFLCFVALGCAGLPGGRWKLPSQPNGLQIKLRGFILALNRNFAGWRKRISTHKTHTESVFCVLRVLCVLCVLCGISKLLKAWGAESF